MVEQFPLFVSSFLLERTNSAGYGLVIIDRKTWKIVSEEYSNSDQQFYPASSLKTLIAVSALQKIESGHGQLHDKIMIDQANAANECKFWDCSVYGPGKFVAIHDLIRDSLVVSNNIATNQLIDWVGKDKINQTADQMGCKNLRVVRKLYSEFPIEPNIKERNSATARDLAKLYVELASESSKILSKEHKEILFGDLGNLKHNDRLNFLFPKGVKFYHKTGSTSDSSSDFDSFTSMVIERLFWLAYSHSKISNHIKKWFGESSKCSLIKIKKPTVWMDLYLTRQIL